MLAGHPVQTIDAMTGDEMSRDNQKDFFDASKALYILVIDLWDKKHKCFYGLTEGDCSNFTYYTRVLTDAANEIYDDVFRRDSDT